MSDWIKTTVHFIPSEISEEEFECYSDEQKEAQSEIRGFRFRLSKVCVYNKNSDGKTSIRMDSGYEVTVDIQFEKFDKLIFPD